MSSLFQLIKIFIPITLSLLSSSLLLFLDRTFIAHYSLESLEACTTAVSICLFVQIPFIRIANMTNPMVGNLIGRGEKEEVGSSVWQMIWFSLMSSIIAVPLGILAIHFVLKRTMIETLAIQYLQIILPFNFLFPLGAVLSSFYIASGKRWFTLKVTIAAHMINMFLNYLLIFGVDGIIPSLGIRGAAIGTVIAQLCYCLFLFSPFARQKEYLTDKARLLWSKFLKIIWRWSPFGIAKLIMLAYWLIFSRMMLLQGEIGVLILSIGATLFGTFIFINDGFNQAIITSASHLLGANRKSELWKLIRSAFCLLILISCLLTLPCIFFRRELFSNFITTPLPLETISLLLNTSLWIWCFFIFDGYLRIFQSLLFASGDGLFHLIIQVIFGAIISVGLNFLLLNFSKFSTEKTWVIFSIESLLVGTVFLFRSSHKIFGRNLLPVNAASKH